MEVEAQRGTVMISAVVAVVGTIIWLVLVALGFSAFAKERKPLPGPDGTPLPISKLAVAAAAVSLGSAFLGPFVIVGQLVGAVLAMLVPSDANAPSRTLARWVLVWAAALLIVVSIVAILTLSSYL